MEMSLSSRLIQISGKYNTPERLFLVSELVERHRRNKYTYMDSQDWFLYFFIFFLNDYSTKWMRWKTNIFSPVNERTLLVYYYVTKVYTFLMPHWNAHYLNFFFLIHFESHIFKYNYFMLKLKIFSHQLTTRSKKKKKYWYKSIFPTKWSSNTFEAHVYFLFFSY